MLVRTETISPSSFDASFVVKLLKEAKASLETVDGAILHLRVAPSVEQRERHASVARLALGNARKALQGAFDAALGSAADSLLGGAARDRVFALRGKANRLEAALEEALGNWDLPIDDAPTRALVEQQRKLQEQQLLEDSSFAQLLVEERSRDVKQIEADLTTIAVRDGLWFVSCVVLMRVKELHTDLAHLLAVQEPSLLDAQAQIESSVTASSTTVEALGAAETAANAARKRKFWLVVGVTVVVLTAGIGILAWRKIVA